MKKRNVNKIMDTLRQEDLIEALYMVNALLLIQKESTGKENQSGIITDHFRQQGTALSENYEGLRFFSEKVDGFNKEAFYQLCNAVKNVKKRDIHNVVFDIYEGLKANQRHSLFSGSASLINNKAFYHFIQATIDFSKIKSVYDPAFGIGMGFVSILKTRKAKHIALAGQEIDALLWANMKNILAIFDRPSREIYQGDTLQSPSNVAEETIVKYDLVLVDSPQGLKIDTDVFARDEFMRFKYGYTTKSEMAFLEHALASKKETGLLIGLINMNSLKEKGKEKAIRKNILLDNNLTTVIQLEKTNDGFASFTPCILIFGENQQSDKIAMMAYKDRNSGESQGLSEYYLSEDEKRSNSIWVVMDEIKNNDYSLTPSFYIDRERLKQVNPLFEALEKREKISLNVIADISSGISGGIKTLSENQKADKPNKIYFLKSSDIDTNGYVAINTEKTYWYGKDDKGVTRTVLAKNDLVFVTRGDTGKVGLVREIPEDAQIGAGMNMIKIHVKTGQYSPFLLFELFKSPYGKHLIETAILEAGVLKKVTLKELAEFRIPILQKRELAIFDDTYLKLLQEEERLRRQMTALKEKKQAVFTEIWHQ